MTREVRPEIRQGHDALREAISICGSRAELARRINVHVPCTDARIGQWFRLGMAVPPRFAPFIAHAVQDRVSVAQLCPQFAHGWALLRKQLATGHKRERKQA